MVNNMESTDIKLFGINSSKLQKLTLTGIKNLIKQKQIWMHRLTKQIRLRTDQVKSLTADFGDDGLKMTNFIIFVNTVNLYFVSKMLSE